MKTKDDFKNTAIKAVEEGDGKKIIEFYEKLGFENERHGWSGDSNGGRSLHSYYGAGKKEITFNTIKPENFADLPNVRILPMSTIDDYGKEEVKLTFPRKMIVWDNEHSRKSEEVVVGFCESLEYPWIVEYGRSDKFFYLQCGRQRSFPTSV